MRSSSAHRYLWLAFSLLLIATTVFAQSRQPNGSQNLSPRNKKEPLADNENPELIGKRNINKLQINFYSHDKEVAVGRQFAQEVDRSAKLVDDPVIVEYINKVGQNLVLHSDAKVPFTIKVIDSDEINAFALPGGYFYVNKGLILAADNEAELAGPMAHEIAHVAARHGVEQASKGQIVNWGSLPLVFLGGWGGFAVQQAAGLAIPLGFLKFSRGAENEADSLGAQYLWATGYDPHAMTTFFEKLQAQEKKKPGTISRIFSTHPMVGDRIDRVNSLISRFPDRNEWLVTSSEFDQVKARLISITNARVGHRPGETDAKKPPTLKRRQAGSEGAEAGGQNGEEPKERPTLRRGESSSKSPNS
ncbi:MAG TPA: M48 family metallopeptidase [Blastocatellia bacterium]|nr:M48 family metallopeptidase [Blastocatellia bacterium]